MKMYPPVIIIGMSRSGTSLLTRMLESMGLFVGKCKDSNNESLFFVDLNEWFLEQCSAGLENPCPIKYLTEDDVMRKAYVDYLRDIMKTPRVVSYLGLTKYLAYGSPDKIDRPWGWKDPRNTYTLPIWLEVFDGAKVLHIYRHALDVINSLRVRRNRGLSKLKGKEGWFKPFYWFYLMYKYVPNKRILDLRCSSIEEGLLMWEEYMTEARKHVRNLKDRSMEVRYEDLLNDPVTILKEIADFCNLKTTEHVLKSVAGMANKNRAFAYLKDPELKAFASKPDVITKLKELGY
jgi:hypothetical protein